MTDRVIHVSEAEAVSDFAGLLARVRAGAEVVVENGELPEAVIHAPAAPRGTLSECIALAKAREAETGEVPVLDADFAADMEDILKHRLAWDPPAWE
jgi:antitoxin (DNA-binding transcriptional repressor) of toxin-antitoxin stability system